MIFIRLLTLFVFTVSTTAALHAPKATVVAAPVVVTDLRSQEDTPSLTPAALTIRGGGVVDSDLYVNVVKGILWVYGLWSRVPFDA
jgi:hypothetical protein